MAAFPLGFGPALSKVSATLKDLQDISKESQKPCPRKRKAEDLEKEQEKDEADNRQRVAQQLAEKGFTVKQLLMFWKEKMTLQCNSIFFDIAQ